MQPNNFKNANFVCPKPANDSLKNIKNNLKKLLINSIKQRIPKQKFGILFSGGIDSVFIAYICKQLNLDFTCYTAAIDEQNLATAEDLIWAEKAAKELNLKLKIKKIKIKQTENYIKKIIKILKDSNVVKVGVALPLYIAMEQAKKDGIKVMFSGLGSEEIFAGYERHLKSDNINKECVNGLNNLYERDLERDILISKANNIELKLPFLDKELIDYSLKIPSKYKIKNKHKKYILRLVAEDLKIPKELAFRPKKAAQYGSKFDGAIKILSKRNHFNKKSDYLDQFNPNPKLGALVSGGKDSIYAMYLMRKQGFPIKCIMTMHSKNKDSYMFHTPNVNLVKLQAEAMNLPLIEETTAGEKEKELKDLKKLIEKTKKQHKIEGITTGALFSQYQKDRIEKICKELKLKCYSPLWHKDQAVLMKELIDNNFEVIITSIAAEGLSKDLLNKKIDDKILNFLIILSKKNKINIAGEGGEYESLVLNCPLFHKRLIIEDYSIIEESKNVARMVVKKAKLIDKY